MATRGGIIFKANNEDCIKLYNHWDSYPLGLGVEINEFLKSITFVNGLGAKEQTKVANGIGCMIAQFIAEKKEVPGNLYVEPFSTDFEHFCGIEYIYTINATELEGGVVLDIEVYDTWAKTNIFKGDLKSFDEWLTKKGREIL